MPIIRKLGAKPAIPAKLCRTLKLEHYATAAFAEFVPPEFDWMLDVPDYGDLNDEYGDCVVAAQAKMVRSWTANATGVAATITNAQIMEVYMNGAGYIPGRPDTDRGWDLISGLTYWQKIGIGGHRIGAYAALNPLHPRMIRAATYLFGGTYTAFDLPNSIWDQTDAGKPWDVVANDGGPAGGHCVTIQAVAANGNPVCRTWGKPQVMTWPFVFKYCTEAYAAIATDYLNGGRTIAGLDVAKLTADLALVRL
jgi:hypothetical protein